MENRWRDLKIMWSEKDSLIGRPKSLIACRAKRAFVPFTRFFFSRTWTGARSLNKLLSRMGQAHRVNDSEQL